MSYSPPSSAKPFTLNVSDQDLSEWRQLLQLSKIAPDTYEGRQDDGRFGVSRAWLQETKEYWLNKYDWRTQEKRINSFPNFKMQIEDVDLHFIGLFSENKDAVPILFMHGWPGSFLEFLPLLSLVREQYSAKNLPYHIIVPSIPGYTLSVVKSVDKEWKLQDSTRVLNQLMLNLGFDKYLAQGGDVGSFVAHILSETYDACVGIHVNMPTFHEAPDENVLNAAEKEAMGRGAQWASSGTAYAQEHCTRPSTIGSVLSSSPLALLAWIGEKFLEWSDETPALDDILTNISLYWFTASFARSIYPYRDLFGPGAVKPGDLTKPTGFSFFPYELAPGIKHVIERHCNLVFYKQHERGGHFAALEKPKELWADVEEFVGKAWKPWHDATAPKL
ncbi:hypothetical protein ACN47E_006269 [Coniothyrium glycines]